MLRLYDSNMPMLQNMSNTQMSMLQIKVIYLMGIDNCLGTLKYLINEYSFIRLQCRAPSFDKS